MKKLTLFLLTALLLASVFTGCSASAYMDDPYAGGYSNVSTTRNGYVNGTNGYSGMYNGTYAPGYNGYTGYNSYTGSNGYNNYANGQTGTGTSAAGRTATSSTTGSAAR